MNNSRNDEFLTRLGKRVRKLRTEKGLSMDDLAAVCQIEKKLIYLIEKGKVNTTVSTVAVLAEAFGITVAELFEGV